MVVDFSGGYWPEKPVLVLRDPDGTPLITLGNAYGLTADFCFNELSTIEFDIPAAVNGVPTPRYDDIVGLREVSVEGVGVFVLNKPKTTGDGLHEIKHCAAYSRESEWNRKRLSLEENVYQFWNPIRPENTLLGILMADMPSWSVGYVSPTLMTTWRNLDSEYTCLYDFIKNTVQKAYGCVFDFETAARQVNVYSVNDPVLTKAVYLSTENLLKEIEIEEDTDNIVTSLDVNGAEGVDIRAVNPMGTNQLYNLDYMIRAGMVPAELAVKWEAWKQAYEAARLPFYQLILRKISQTGALLTEQEALRAMKDRELAELQNTWSVKLAYLATLTAGSEEAAQTKAEVDALAGQIAAKEAEIDAQSEQLDDMEDADDALDAEIDLLRRGVQWTWVDEQRVVHYNFGLTADDLKLLDRLLIENSIEESSFLLDEVDSYSESGVTARDKDITFRLNTAQTEHGEQVWLGDLTELLGQSGRRMFSANGGEVRLTGDTALEAAVVRLTADAREDGTCVISARLGAGTITDDGEQTAFPSGSLSITGAWSGLSTDVQPDADTPSIAVGTELQMAVTGGTVVFTRNTTEHETYSVEWDLLEYGEECLEKLAWPSYSFSIDSANFLNLEQFRQFASELELGKRVYLNSGRMGVLTPVLVKVHVEYDDPSKLALEFGSTFNLKDSAFQVADLLEQSVSMGKTVDTGKRGFGRFISSGAGNAVRNYMNTALDFSKQTLLSSSGMDIQLDGAGLWLRRRLQDGSYDDRQIAGINNSLLFTDDNWGTVKMAIGEINDPNTGTGWGIATPALFGTLVAGNELWIESDRADGGVAEFLVNGEGVSLHNAQFTLYNATASGNHGRIDLNARFGIVGGVDGTGTGAMFTYDANGAVNGIRSANGNTLTRVSDITTGTGDPKPNFWIDMDGQVYIKGKLYAESGSFSGSVHANDVYVYRDGDWVPVSTDNGATIDGQFVSNIVADTISANTEIETPTIYGGRYYAADRESYMEIANTVNQWSGMIDDTHFKVWSSIGIGAGTELLNIEMGTSQGAQLDVYLGGEIFTSYNVYRTGNHRYYFPLPCVFARPCTTNYGSASDRDNIASPFSGEIFFVTE